MENVVVWRINLNAVQLSILLDCPGESFVALHRGQTSRAPSGAGKGKRPLVRKTIKYTLAAGESSVHRIVVDLIQVESGLLSALQIDLKTRPCDIDLQNLGNLAEEQAGDQRKPLRFAYRYIIALDNGGGRE